VTTRAHAHLAAFERDVGNFMGRSKAGAPIKTAAELTSPPPRWKSGVIAGSRKALLPPARAADGAQSGILPLRAS
jgi:hypothetical protein